MQSVLVVDDEPAIVTLLTYNLEQAQYAVTSVTDGPAALTAGLTGKFDFILLDLMLPGLDGLEVTKRLRQEKIKTPILILTAKDEEFDKVIGLELGADDYITKPFSPREIIARMKAIERRLQPQTPVQPEAPQQLQFGTLVIDPVTYQVTKAGEPIQLTPREYQILLFLAQHPRQVFSREQLLNGVWGFDFTGQTRMVDIQISHLREKIETDPKQPVYLKTVRGFGYRFEGPGND